ncbi:MAG: TonB-dependent receptor plug domain-containing protein [Edaphocola sp.]
MYIPAKIQWLALLLFFISIGNGHAQVRDTLHEVEINQRQLHDTTIDVRNGFATHFATHKIGVYKDLFSSLSLAQLLSGQSAVFVKSYGVNSLATMALRGASAAQSTVLWNGVPIANPALGVADLSMLRTGLFNNINLQYGGAAALYGSGNVGGALLLDNTPTNFNGFDKRYLNGSWAVGSFGKADAALNGFWQKNKLAVQANGFYQGAKNNIRYTDEQGDVQTLPHAKMQGGGTLLAADYRLSNNWFKGNNARVYAKIWWQQYQRQLPPAMFESSSAKVQHDRSLRTLLGWEQNKNAHTWYFKTSYNNERLRYQDSLVAIDNTNTAQQSYTEFGWKWNRRSSVEKQKEVSWQHRALLFFPIQIAWASGANINGIQRQTRPAIAAAYSLSLGKYDTVKNNRPLTVNANVRQEWLNGKANPFLLGIGAQYFLLQKSQRNTGAYQVAAKGNVQRTYRVPTLNELYYFPGGNANLQPEQGWCYEGGLEATWEHESWELDNRTAAYHRAIKDWIYWLGGAIWTPYNIAKVSSRGVETSTELTFRKSSKLKFHLSANYAYCLATSVASYLPGDNSIGKQIPYTPRYNFQANAGVEWNALFLNFNQTYTGYRFVTIDESQYLKPYNTSNIQVYYTLSKNGKLGSVALQCNNIFNTQYQVVNGRPMPGRNLLLQLGLGLGKG